MEINLIFLSAESWSEQSCDDFEELTYCAQWKVVMAKTIRYKSSERGLIPCLHMIDTNGEQVRGHKSAGILDRT